MRSVLSDIQFREVLDSAFGRPDTVYLQQPGNMGDALIGSGLLNIVGKDVVRLIPSDSYTGRQRSVVFSGGGILNMHYEKHFAPIARFLNSNGGKLTILPHTISGCDSLVRSFDERFTVVVRDLASYNYVKRLNGEVSCYLHRDLAFYANLETSNIQFMYSALRETAKAAFVRRGLLKNARLLKIIALWRPQGNVLVARTDVESSGALRLPHAISNSFDISSLYPSAYASITEIEFISSAFIALCNRMSKIFTDRLHVAIAGARLGKEVVLYDNNYGKNRAVYDFSLKEFDNVKFERERD